jgi:hypothetical protein
MLPPGFARLGTTPAADRITDQRHDDGNGAGGALGSERCPAAFHDDYIDSAADQISHRFGHVIVVATTVPPIDQDVRTLDIAGVAKPLSKRLCFLTLLTDTYRHDANAPWSIGLLCFGDNRPCERHTAETGDDIPPSHSITSSARRRMDGGMVMPRVLAVLRFKVNTNFDGSTTGSSATSPPWRMRSRYCAAPG